MAIELPIPPDAEQILRSVVQGDLERYAYEALVIKLYQDGRIGTHRVAQLVGLQDRWDGERWLGERGVNWNYDVEELERDLETIQRLLPQTRPNRSDAA